MKDKKARIALKELCNVLGISYCESWGEIEIDEYSHIGGGDPYKRPVARTELDKVEIDILGNQNQLKETIKLLLDYLGLQIIEGKRIEKRKGNLKI